MTTHCGFIFWCLTVFNRHINSFCYCSTFLAFHWKCFTQEKTEHDCSLLMWAHCFFDWCWSFFYCWLVLASGNSIQYSSVLFLPIHYVLCHLWTKNIGSYITTNETSSPLYNHNSSSVPATLFHFVDEETFKTIPTVLDDFGGWHNTPLEGRIQKRHLVLPIQFNTLISLHCLPGWINPATPHNGLHYEAKQFSSFSPKIQNCNFKCSINAIVIFFFSNSDI